jgi:hypothetical protein
LRKLALLLALLAVAAPAGAATLPTLNDEFDDPGHVDWIHFVSTGVPGPLRRAVLAGKRPPAALTRYLNR